ALEIELAVVDAEHVSGRAAFDPPVSQRSPQSRHIVVEGVAGARRRRLAPQTVDQAIARDRFVRVQKQDRENRALLRTTKADPSTIRVRLDPAEDLELHGRSEPLFRPLFELFPRRVSDGRRVTTNLGGTMMYSPRRIIVLALAVVSIGAAAAG